MSVPQWRCQNFDFFEPGGTALVFTKVDRNYIHFYVNKITGKRNWLDIQQHSTLSVIGNVINASIQVLRNTDGDGYKNNVVSVFLAFFLAGSWTIFRGSEMWRHCVKQCWKCYWNFFILVSSYRGGDWTGRGRYIAHATITGTGTTTDICVCFSMTANWLKSKIKQTHC